MASVELVSLCCISTRDLFCRDRVELSVWVDGVPMDVLRRDLEEGYEVRLGRTYGFRHGVRLEIAGRGDDEGAGPDPDRFELVTGALGGLAAGRYPVTARMRSHGSSYRCELRVVIAPGDTDVRATERARPLDWRLAAARGVF